MKRFMMFGMAMLFSAAMLGRAEAALISGDISFGGNLLSTLNLGTTTIVDFDPQDAVVTFVTLGSGLDTTINRFDTADFKDFQFNPFVANNPLWTSGGFSFNLASVTIGTQNASSLVLLGTGTIIGNGFDATPYDWSFSADRNGGTVAFSATNAASPVPEPGSLLLLGSGLIGLAWLRRKQNS